MIDTLIYPLRQFTDDLAGFSNRFMSAVYGSFHFILFTLPPQISNIPLKLSRNDIMMQNKHKTIFWVGLIVFFLINLVTSLVLEPHMDENYYWVYSRFPAWGYFDHPPMVAWLIAAGQLLLPGFLGMRFLFVVLSALTFLIVWELTRKYYDNALLYWLIIMSVAMFIPYTLVAVPDVPLMFFTALFLLIYREFLEKDTPWLAVLLGIAAAGMVYSKYHAFLVLLLVVLSNIRVLKNWKMWMAGILALILLVPHFYWQYSEGFPSFRYHLVDSHKTAYKFEVTLSYIINQIVLTGPFIGWFLLYAATKARVTGEFGRTLKFIFLGVFLFFFLVTFGGDIEPHWALAGYLPMVVLAMAYVGRNPRWKPLIIKIAVFGSILTFVVRIVVLSIGPKSDMPFLARYFNNLKDKRNIYETVGDLPVVFQDTYFTAAAYAHANNMAEATFHMAPGFSRYTQYDIYPIEEWLQDKPAIYVTRDSTFLEGDQVIITGGKNVWYARKIDRFRSFNMLEVTIRDSWVTRSGRSLRVDSVSIYNPYDRKLELAPESSFSGHLQCYRKGRRKWDLVGSTDLPHITIEPGQQITLTGINLEITGDVSSEPWDYFIGLSTGFFLPVHSGLIKTFAFN